ncbi:nitrogen fixation protein NifX [Syntrophobotulus glycolicus DSM 8271]|uniref:Nitrogen fixation protein NifX n=1 Tax=Syntrophobotulus glycolicus (strain DSM 8271 / FlGlyR) TaxID=645991 RepID=F0SYJ6_SYNGF|nr:nitrogen fixation protein NifX [Syntrophobotulus glycolicus]ADY57108.1 nitrogen fixation protein NifX [Syntrophobotulus glycolicus DSM 8271]
MLVAFATTGEDKVNAHFGMAPAFAVYEITPGDYRFVKTISLPEQASEDDKVEARADMLKECTIVYCNHIGGPAAARLVQQNIQPLKVKEGTPIIAELERLQTILRESPPPWLRKRLAEEMENKGELP